MLKTSKKIYHSHGQLNHFHSKYSNDEQWRIENKSEIITYLIEWRLCMKIMLENKSFMNQLIFYFINSWLPLDKRQEKLHSILTKLELAKKHQKISFAHCDTKLNNKINVFMKHIYAGVVVSGRRIYPEIYFPFLDETELEFDSWKKNILGIGIADFRNKLVSEYEIIHLPNTNFSNKENSAIGRCNGNCTCTQDKIEVVNRTSPTLVDSDQVFYTPILLMGYYMNGKEILSREMKIRCYCTRSAVGDGTYHCQQSVSDLGCGSVRNTGGNNPCGQNTSLCARHNAGGGMSSNF